MLDSLVRVSRRVWCAHLISESRNLNNWHTHCEHCNPWNFKEVPQIQHQNTIRAPLRLSRDPFFLRQASIFPLWNLVRRSEFTQTQLCPARLTHSEAPIDIVHPSMLQETCASRFDTGKLHKPSACSGWDVNRTRHCTHQVPFQRFHALFHSLFRVLFIFPSRYLFAIGLVSIFSFRWSIPPTSDCTLKQSYSMKGHHKRQGRQPGTGLAPSLAAYSKAFRSPLTRTLPL